MSAPGKFRRKPVVIEAMRWDGTRPSIKAICRWTNDTQPLEDDPAIAYNFTTSDDVFDVTIDTLEGLMTASPGDWIIRGVQGEFYPCKPDIFAVTYEAVGE